METKIVQPVKGGDNIIIIGKRWFDKANGNTYFSSKALVNGNEVCSIDFQYGYGDHYITETFELLEKLGYLPGVKHHNNGSSEPFWSYCERNNIVYNHYVIDVSRKKDL